MSRRRRKALPQPNVLTPADITHFAGLREDPGRLDQLISHLKKKADLGVLLKTEHALLGKLEGFRTFLNSELAHEKNPTSQQLKTLRQAKPGDVSTGPRVTSRRLTEARHKAAGGLF